MRSLSLILHASTICPKGPVPGESDLTPQAIKDGLAPCKEILNGGVEKTNVAVSSLTQEKRWQEVRFICSVGLQADTADSSTCPPEAVRYTKWA
jgi:hypothetical protein